MHMMWHRCSTDVLHAGPLHAAGPGSAEELQILMAAAGSKSLDSGSWSRASSGAHGGQALPQAGVEHEVERGEGGVGGHGGQQAAVQACEALIARDGGQR